MRNRSTETSTSTGHGKMIRRAWAVLTILMMGWSVGHARTLRVGVYDNYPLVYVDSAGKPAGLHVDLLDAIATAEGWTLEYRIMTWSDVYALTKRKALDIATSMVHTREREQWFDFGQVPVATLWGQIVLPANSPVRTLQSLDGARVGVLRAGINGKHFRALTARLGLAPKFKAYDDYDHIMTAIQSGELDAGVINSFWALNLKDYTGLVASDIVFTPSKVGFGFSKGMDSEVITAVDHWLREWKSHPDSTYFRAMLRYGLISDLQPADGVEMDVKAAYQTGLTLLMVVLLGTVAWLTWRLRRRIGEQSGRLATLLQENNQLISELGRGNELFVSVTQAFPDLVWIINASGGFEQRLGATPTHLDEREENVIGRSVEEKLPPPYGAQVLEAIGRALETGQVQNLKMSYESRRDQRVHTWEVRIAPIEPRQIHRKVVAVIRDITNEQVLREQRDRDHRLLDAFARAMPDLGFILTASGDYVMVIGDESLLADSPEKLIGRNIRDVLPASVCDELMSTIGRALKTGRVESLEYTLDVPAGTRHFDARLVVPNVEARGGERHVVLVSRDVTERIHAENQIRRLAYFDEVTGLPNRKAFYENLAHALSQARRHHTSVALLMLDLDDFKGINDTWGHPAGDRLLAEIASRLRNNLRASDEVARLGGDEFVILHREVKHLGDIAKLCGKLLALLAEPVDLGSGVVTPHASLGIALSESGAVDQAELLRRADMALYRAKSAGKGQWAFYDEQLSRQFAQQVTLIQDLEAALNADDQLYLVYQPQIDNETGRLVGVEALLRWQHPEKGLIPPGQFIPHIENNHLVHSLGEYVIRQAAHQVAEWERLGIAPASVAVNVSAHQFRNPNFAVQLLMWLDDAGVDPARFEIEVTETAFLNDLEEAARVMAVLTKENIRLSLDDFGTGYSSLLYLQRFPFYKLKIDREFTRGIEHNSSDREIVRAIIGLARNLGMSCIAEGVETAGQLALLRAWGCELSQGYYFDRPMTAETLTSVLCGDKVPDWPAKLVPPDVTAH